MGKYFPEFVSDSQISGDSVEDVTQAVVDLAQPAAAGAQASRSRPLILGTEIRRS